MTRTNIKTMPVSGLVLIKCLGSGCSKYFMILVYVCQVYIKTCFCPVYSRFCSFLSKLQFWSFLPILDSMSGYRKILFLFLLGLFFVLVNSVVKAQSLTGVAYKVLVENSQSVSDGTLVSLVEGVYVIADLDNLDDLAGVINFNPQLEIDTVGDPLALPLVKSGIAYVRVSSENGPISMGAVLSLSSQSGVAALATGSRLTTLGRTMESFDGEGEGLIKVDVAIQNPVGLMNSEGMKTVDVARESFFELFKVFQNASQVPAPQAFKFVLAGLVLLATILFGFFTFGRVAQRGVEAIGRNPLAKNTILVGLIINVAISITVIFSGLVAAYYIIRL